MTEAETIEKLHLLRRQCELSIAAIRSCQLDPKWLANHVSPYDFVIGGFGVVDVAARNRKKQQMEEAACSLRIKK